MELASRPVRRIPAYRWHQGHGAAFKVVDGAEIVSRYGTDVEAQSALELAALDLSALPRCGFKGPGTVDWLTAQGVVVPPKHNTAAPQTDGSLVLRCGSTDILIAGDIAMRTNRPAQLKISHATAIDGNGYDALREEGYAWFMLLGNKTPSLLAHVCEVDLRPQVFSDLEIAQTRVANLSTIVARWDLGRRYAVHLFFDVASSVYFCETISELLEKLGGKFIGYDSLSFASEDL